MNDYHECAQCGEELGDEYVVHEWPIPHPIRRGEMNPVTAYGLLAYINIFKLVFEGRDAVSWNLETSTEVATHTDCRRPFYLPRTNVDKHYTDALLSGLLAWSGVLSLSDPATSLLSSVVVTAAFAAVFVGELWQIGRHKQTDLDDLRLDARRARNTDNPAASAREAYLRGEIDEDELEARLDDANGEQLDETTPDLLTEER